MTAAASSPPILLLVMLMVASQVAITIFLPSLPAIADDLGTSQALAQMTVSAYLGTFALAQLVVGPLSDAVGRRGPLLAGLVLFTLGSAACAFAPDITVLIAARVMQAIGGCTCIVISRAIVRDTTDGAAATRAMAYLGMALAVAPMVAPLIGGQLEARFGWQSSFLATALLGAGALAATVATLRETLPPGARKLTRPGVLALSYVRLARMARFMGYSLSTGSMGAAFQAFIAGTPVAFIVVMGVSPENFGFFILTAPAGYIIGNYISQPARATGVAHAHDLDGERAGDDGHRRDRRPGAGRTRQPRRAPAADLRLFLGFGFHHPQQPRRRDTAVEPASAGSAAALGGFIQMGAGFLSTMLVTGLVQTSFLQLGLLMLGCTPLS